MKTLRLIMLIAIAVSLCACTSPNRESSIILTSAPPVENCSDTAVTQFDLNKCASQKAEAAHSKLSSLLDELRSRMDMAQYQKLASVQNRWETAAEEHCQWEADFFAGGSVQPMWLAGCLEKQYRQRIEALRLNLCEGHGMTGDCNEALKYK